MRRCRIEFAFFVKLSPHKHFQIKIPMENFFFKFELITKVVLRIVSRINLGRDLGFWNQGILLTSELSTSQIPSREISTLD